MPRKPTKTVPPAYEISDRVRWQASKRTYQPRQPGTPALRPLRIFTLDPSVTHRFGGVATVQVPYESLAPGPVGALFEFDLAGAPKSFRTAPLDLDDKSILLASGLAPTPSNPQFHVQMVYAVCSLTYAAFRRALGRRISWAVAPAPGGEEQARLKVRPFGLRQKNAYYDRDEGCLSFGYFRAGARPAGHTVPKGMIFTALSHDVIAHETTHALLDALRSEFYFPSSADVLAFHEGFADLVALFLHFSHPAVVESALHEARGRLTQAGLLSSLAQEFGHATSKQGSERALRTAIDVEGLDDYDSDRPAGARNAPKAYRADMEVHELGSVLVSAVFEAFATIFRRKSERYLRIAGIAPAELGARELPPELLRLLAELASELAGQFLNICIRAIDYCPPVDISLGEYLRALVTADAELERTDKWGYREALMRSFRRRELFPAHVEFMTEDAVCWQRPATTITIEPLAFRNLRFEGDPALPADAAELERQARELGAFVSAPANAKLFHLIAPGAPLPAGVEYAGLPRVESVRTARRVTPDGRIVFDLVAEVIQSGTVRVGGELSDCVGGCTIVVDPQGEVRYVIFKRIASAERRKRQMAAIKGPLKGFWEQVPASGKRGAAKKSKAAVVRYRAKRGVVRRLHACGDDEAG